MFRNTAQNLPRIAPKSVSAPSRVQANVRMNAVRSVSTATCRTVETKTTVASRSVRNSNGSRFLSVSTPIHQQINNSAKKQNWMYGVAAGATALALIAANSEESQAGGEAAAPVDYNAVRQAIIKLLDQDDNRGPLFVRLAWHASGTYDKTSKTGGSNGATMRYQPEAGFGANYGLEVARELLEPLKKEFPGISFADLWTLSAAVAIEYMGGPVIPWRSGRSDAPSRTACPPDGRLPDADKGSSESTSQHLRDIFYRMGFSDQEIVALAGAHALGRCHQDRSGYLGPWTRAPTSFSNQYFKELLETKWTPKKWDGPLQYEDPTGELMMLPADLAFVQDAKFKPFVEKYAADEKLFFADFAKAFQKLEELGCNFDSKPAAAAPAPAAAAPAPEQKPAKKGWW